MKNMPFLQRFFKRFNLFLAAIVMVSLFMTAGAIHSGPLSQGLTVTQTIPATGETDVNPNLTEIVVAFSAPVKQNSWSFVVTDQGQFPEMTGDPYFPDNQTCVLPVVLKPGVQYSLSINSARWTGFKSAADETITVTSYVLTFTTGEVGQAVAAPDSPESSEKEQDSKTAPSPKATPESEAGWGFLTEPTKPAPQETPTPGSGWGFMAESGPEAIQLPESAETPSPGAWGFMLEAESTPTGITGQPAPTPESSSGWGFISGGASEPVSVVTVAPPPTQVSQPAASTGGLGTVVLRQYTDQSEQAFTILVPDGWKTQGGILRINPLTQGGSANSIAAKLDFAVMKDDQNSVFLYFAPEMMYCDPSKMPSTQLGLNPIGGNYKGMLLWPLPSAVEFLTQMLFPQLHPQATQVQIVDQRPIPELAQKYWQRQQASSIQTTFSYDAAVVTLTYEENGARYKEKLFTVIEDYGELGVGMWDNKETIAMRSPENDFDVWEPLLITVQDSFRLNPQWMAAELQGQIQRGELQWKNQQEIARMAEEIVEHRRETYAEIRNDMYLNMSNQEEYINPYTNEVETGTNQYQNRWQNSMGDVIYTDDPNYDPNWDPNLKLPKDFKSSEVRPRGPMN